VPQRSTNISYSSYDGDDAPAPTTLVPINSVPPNQPTTQQSNPTPQEEEPDTAYVPPPFEAVENPQRFGNDTQNGSTGFSGGRGQDRDDVSMNNEPFGSGIKEDG
jgi:hypothetical protein